LGKDELTIVAKNSLNTIATEINTLPSKGVRTPANNYSWLNLLLGGGNAHTKQNPMEKKGETINPG
jgi:hypothetical protein